MQRDLCADDEIVHFLEPKIVRNERVELPRQVSLARGAFDLGCEMHQTLPLQWSGDRIGDEPGTSPKTSCAAHSSPDH